MKKQFTRLIGACCVSIFLLLISTTGVLAQYCAGASTNTSDEWLSHVEFAGINNSSGSTTYSDFTSIVGTVVPGVSYEFSGTISIAGTFTETITVYIDWDQSETWEATERYTIGTSCTTDGCILTDDIEVPLTAIPGETRMRVVQQWNVAGTNPCATFTYGEVEDYTINVESGDCTPPSLTYDVTNNCVNDTYALTVHINDLGSSTSATLFHKRSDGVPVNNTNLNQFLIGQTITISNAIPFGVTVRDSIVSGNPICTLIRNFEEEICPAENDEPCDATPLVCGDNLIDETFIGATFTDLPDACFGDKTRDIWYTFEADGSQHFVVGATGNDVVVALYTSSDCGELTQVGSCSDFPESFDVTEAGTYYFRVRPYFAGALYDFVDISLNCVPFDCPDLLADVGASCDDGDPNTFVDVLQEDCSCAGFVPVPGQLCEVPLEVNSLPYTTTDNTVNYFDDYNYTLGNFPPLAPGAIVAPGSSTSPYLYMGGDDVVYSYTATENVSLNFSLTNHGTWSGLFVFSGCPFASTLGYATTTGTAPMAINGVVIEEGQTIYVVISTFPTPQAIAYTLSIESVPFDCPSLEANYGTPCDDGDANTVYDEINENCECAGTPIAENDDICDATTIDCGETLTQSYLGASPSPEGSCANGVSNDIWYQFTTEEGMFYQVDIVSTVNGVSSTYSNVEVLVGEAGADCNSELVEYVPCGIYLSIYMDTVATYFVRAQPVSVQETLEIRLSCFEVPENGECTTATDLVCGETYTGATSAAPQRDPNQPFCGALAPSEFNTGVWFTYEPETDFVMNFELDGTYDTQMFLYSGACDELVCEAGNNGLGNTAALSDTLYAGTTYYLYVTGSGNGRGEYELNVSCIDLECSPTISSLILVDANGTPLGGCADLGSEYYVEVTLEGGLDEGYVVSLNGGTNIIIEPNGTGIVGPEIAPNPGNVSVFGVTDVQCATSGTIQVPICPPSYDTPCGAETLEVDGGIAGPFSNVYSGIDAGEPSPEGIDCLSDWCEGEISNTNWFVINVPEDVERLRISACNIGTTFDTQLAAYSVGNCSDYSSFTLLGANDDQSGGCLDAAWASTLELCVEAGSVLYVQMDGYFGDVGDAFVRVESIDASICQCVLPTVGLESYPVCDGETPSFSVDIVIDDLGSSDYVTISYTLNGEAVVVDNVSEDFTIEGIPLGTFFTVTLTPSDAACSEFGVLTGTVTQGVDACDLDCMGVAGGPAQPGTPCEVDGVSGTFGVNCDCLPAPANDLCSDAIVLACNDYVVGTNVGASLNGGCNDTDRPTVWYSYTPEIDGTVTISTCNPETNFDTDLNVYTGTCDDLNCFSGFGGGGYIDGESGCTYQSWAGVGSFEGVAGVTYYIAVTGYYEIGGFLAWEGDFGLSIVGPCAGSSLTGSVSNWANACGGREATVSLYEPGTATLVASYNTTVAGDGTFLVDEVELGTFDVIVKVAGYLAKGTQDVVIASGDNNLALGAIKFGDFNGNNTVDIFDISTFSVAFGTQTGNPGYNPLADYNCDGVVVLFDVSAINQTYINGAVSGDAAPL